jgi:predicted amidophosphoribosyltransferase
MFFLGSATPIPGRRTNVDNLCKTCGRPLNRHFPKCPHFSAMSPEDRYEVGFLFGYHGHRGSVKDLSSDLEFLRGYRDGEKS